MTVLVSLIFGTRPEAIKLAPVIKALAAHPRLRPHVCVTAQHRQMLDQVLDAFDIKPDADLDLMRPNQTLASLTARAVESIDGYLAEHKPDMVLVQGDTTTTLCATLAAYYRKIPIGHVEAGLRTWNKYAPFPEEGNRVLTSHLADLHFAPTETSRQNLLKEGVPAARIHVTGNTVIDALFLALERIRKKPVRVPELPDCLQPGTDPAQPCMVLITGHRRENFGRGFENICRAIARLAADFPDVHFVYPVHLNPNVREPVFRILKPQARTGRRKAKTENIHLIEPLGYLPFVGMMQRAHVILTDSGGVQEEAPSLGKPVLVMREVTERPEAVKMGTVRLVGTKTAAIVDWIGRLLTDRRLYRTMAGAVNPYGDGTAAARIGSVCADYLIESDRTAR